MVFSEKFYVGYSGTNRDLKLSDSAILKMFEDIATMHSEAVGDGMKATTARWFLTAYQVKIHKRPELGEHVECRTWSRDLRGFTASREFEIYTESGELAVTAISNWARIDTKTGRPERLTPEIGEIYGTERERANFPDAWIGKLKEPENYSVEKDYFIDRNLIDANNHMNNVCYLDLVKCILSDDVYRKEIHSFEIMYRKAVEYAKTVKCCYAEIDKGYIVSVKCDDELMAIVKFS